MHGLVSKELTWPVCVADMSGLESLEAAGDADKAWQRVLQRMRQQRGSSGYPDASQVIA